MPPELVDFFIGKDEETTTANLKKFEKIYSASLSSAVEEKIKGNGYTPPAGSAGSGVNELGLTPEQMKQWKRMNPNSKYK